MRRPQRCLREGDSVTRKCTFRGSYERGHEGVEGREWQAEIADSVHIRVPLR